MPKAPNLQSSLQDLFIKYAPAAIAICDKEMRYLAHSDRWSEDYGLEGESLIGRCHYDLFPDLPDHWKEEHQRCFKGEIIHKEEERFPRKDGSVDWVRRELHPWRDAYGEIGGLIMFTEVVTKRRAAQEALKESERRYRSILDNALMGIYRVEENGRLLMVNQRFAEMFGFDSQSSFLEEIDNIKDLYFDPSQRPGILEEIDRNGFVQRKEVAFKKRDGNIIWLHLNTRRIEDSAGGVFYEGIMEDITELKKIRHEKELLRERLLHDQKKRAIADLAGGIAHQFNNALVGITGNVELLKLHYDDDFQVAPYLDTMMKCARRMSHLTNQLVAYGRGGNYQKRMLTLSEFLKESLPIIGYGLEERIDVEMAVPDEICRVHADPTQMQMVLSAVLNNGAEAIDGRGHISIRVRNRDLDKTALPGNSPLTPGTYVCITITDDGKGMAPESLNRIFDPFFTTKFQGRGMGMAAAYGTVRNHGGWISVASELGKGTTVQIWLPALANKTGKKDAGSPQ